MGQSEPTKRLVMLIWNFDFFILNIHKKKKILCNNKKIYKIYVHIHFNP